jgi:hypothetical protein
MANEQSGTIKCPNCGHDAKGKFCSECGSTLTGGVCVSCKAELAAGAKFCHRCGTPTNPGAKRAAVSEETTAPVSPAATGFAAMAPWAVAGIAIVALTVLVVSKLFSGDNAATAGAADQPANTPLAGAAATDISSMSMAEAAGRLYNRIMRLNSEGKKDSVLVFAPMAIRAFQMIPDSAVNADTRYDLGRVAEVSGALPLAKAQADTILAAAPNNLLGLALAMRVARDMGATKAASSYGKRLIAAAPAERKKDLPGYQQHAPDIDNALKEAAQ